MGKVFLACVGLGAGLAVLASGLTGSSWYNSRQWDTAALQATFDHLEKDLEGNIEFCYQLQNHTSSDYYVDINSQPTLMAKLRQWRLFSSGYEVLVLYHPIAVQAGQRTLVKIGFGKAQSGSPKTIGLGVGQADESERLAGLVNARYGNLEGFVLYDLNKRYRINFPKGW